MTKNYNRISSYIGLNSEIRQYEMPNDRDTYERQCKIEHFVEYGYEIPEIDNELSEQYYNYNILSQNTIFSDYLRATLGALNMGNNSVIRQHNFNAVKSCLIKFNSDDYTENETLNSYLKNLLPTLDASYPTILLECIPKGSGNSISFDFGFNDAISAGEFRFYDETEKKLLKQPIPYCTPNGNRIGFLRNLRYYLSNGDIENFTNDSANTLPLIDRIIGYFDTNPQITRDIVFKGNDIKVLKDPSEILKFTHNLSFVSLSEDITLGRAFFENNYLYKNTTEYNESGYADLADQYNQKFKLYASEEKYSKFDNFMYNGNGTLIFEGFTNGSSSNSSPIISRQRGNYADFTLQFNENIIKQALPNNAKTLILTDENDKILLVVNITEKLYDTIYFTFRSKRSKVVYKY